LLPIPEKTTSKDTIGIRLAGVDAPECAHFGQPGQPFGEEAKYELHLDLNQWQNREKLD